MFCCIPEQVILGEATAYGPFDTHDEANQYRRRLSTDPNDWYVAELKLIDGNGQGGRRLDALLRLEEFLRYERTDADPDSGEPEALSNYSRDLAKQIADAWEIVHALLESETIKKEDEADRQYSERARAWYRRQDMDMGDGDA